METKGVKGSQSEPNVGPKESKLPQRTAKWSPGTSQREPPRTQVGSKLSQLVQIVGPGGQPMSPNCLHRPPGRPPTANRPVRTPAPTPADPDSKPYIYKRPINRPWRPLCYVL